jgi:hypothetical protein
MSGRLAEGARSGRITTRKKSLLSYRDGISTRQTGSGPPIHLTCSRHLGLLPGRWFRTQRSEQ